MWHVLGRETFLAPVDWVDGWPEVDPIELSADRRTPGPVGLPSTSHRDDFDGDVLDPRWLAVRRPPASFCSLDQTPGSLVIHGTDATLDSPFPCFLGRRQQHERCRASVAVDTSSATEAGLCVRMDEAHHYEVGLTGDELVVRARIGPADTVVARTGRPDRPLVLAVETAASLFAPGVVRLGYLDPSGELVVLAELDGRYLSTEVAGGMTGRVIGMYAIGGDAAFDRFEYDEI